MTNIENINQYEGKIVEKIIWPFSKYTVLLPKRITGDLFVWLYLSLVVYFNKSNNAKINDYSNNAKEYVCKLFEEKFRTVLDKYTIAKVVFNAEKSYVINNDTINLEAFASLHNYKSFFSDKLTLCTVYQDAITGDVVPYFEEDVETTHDKDGIELSRLITEKPSTSTILKAYKVYATYKDYRQTIECCETNNEENVNIGAQKQNLDVTNKTVIFLDERPNLVRTVRNVKVKDNALEIQNPFKLSYLDEWFAIHAIKAMNHSKELEQELTAMEEKFLVKSFAEVALLDVKKDDFANRLKHCKKLYRITEGFKDDIILKYVVELDGSIAMNKTKDAYLKCGIIMERMVNITQYQQTDEYTRKNTAYDIYIRHIETKFKLTLLNTSKLKEYRVYRVWQKAKGRNFKGNIADMMLRSNTVTSPPLYRDFIEDMFKLYDLRNEVGAHDTNVTVPFDSKQIEALEKIAKIFAEL